MKTCLKVENLRHRYPGSNSAEALQGLSFEVARGRITGLLGPNGSGKSTTFKILSTQLDPTEGDAWVMGRSVRKEPAAVRAKLGVTFQNPSLDPWLSVAENLLIQTALYGIDRPEANQRISALLKLFRIEDLKERRVKTLSGGQARRVELAKTLLASPEIVLLDEPTTGLDPLARMEFWSELRRLRDAGMTLVVTTHLMDEADLCDDLLFISEGRLAAQGTPRDLKDSLGSEILLAEGEGLKEMVPSLVKMLPASDVVRIVGGRLRVETKEGAHVFEKVRALGGERIHNIQWGKPTLADVYLNKTGKQLS